MCVWDGGVTTKKRQNDSKREGNRTSNKNQMEQTDEEPSDLLASGESGKSGDELLQELSNISNNIRAERTTMAARNSHRFGKQV